MTNMENIDVYTFVECNQCKVTCPCKKLDLRLSVWTAAQLNDFHRIYFLGEKRPDSLFKYDKYGYSALHYAAQNNYIDIVRYLIHKGIPVDSNKCGATPLHRAASSGSYESCLHLITYGADVNARDSSFGGMLTPYEKALDNNHLKVADMIKNHPTFQPIVTEKYESNRQNKMIDIIDDTPTKDCSNQVEVKNTMDTAAVAVTVVITGNSNKQEVGSICSLCNREAISFHQNSLGKLICMKCKYNKKKT